MGLFGLRAMFGSNLDAEKLKKITPVLQEINKSLISIEQLNEEDKNKIKTMYAWLKEQHKIAKWAVSQSRGCWGNIPGEREIPENAEAMLESVIHSGLRPYQYLLREMRKILADIENQKPVKVATIINVCAYISKIFQAEAVLYRGQFPQFRMTGAPLEERRGMQESYAKMASFEQEFNDLREHYQNFKLPIFSKIEQISRRILRIVAAD